MNTQNELHEAQTKLAQRQTLQAQMKRINDAHKVYLKKPSEMLRKFPDLTEKEIHLIENYKAPYSWEAHPFAPFQLSNNSAEIRRLTKRIETLEAKSFEVYVNDGETQAFTFTDGIGGTVLWNYAEDRVQIVYEGKPDAATIQKLKNRGFNWSPTNVAWQRKLTNAAKWDAQDITKCTYTEAPEIEPTEEPKPDFPPYNWKTGSYDVARPTDY